MPAPKRRQHVEGIKVHFDPPLLAWLRLEAKRLDVSISELLRRLVRKEMGV
ncbi:MAG: ribbon-helix-helix protein, CopG family [Pseudomonadota bacterium]